MQKGNFRIKFSYHAYLRAIQRGVYSDIIYLTIQTGKMKQFGKKMLSLRRILKILN